MSNTTEDKLFKGSTNRVINYEGGKILSNDEWIAVAKTYWDAERLIAYWFVPVNWSVEDYIRMKENPVETTVVNEVV